MAQGGREQPPMESTVRENVDFIKEYIEEKLSIHDVVWYETVWTIYVELLNNYMRCVREMFPGMREEGVNGSSVRQGDLQEVWRAIEGILPISDELRPSVVLDTNAYTFCKRSPGAAAENWIHLHLSIVRYLLRDNTTVCTEQLLSLSYWTFAFYSKKAELRHDNYCKISHYLHFDLLMTLITVYWRRHNQSFNFPRRLPSCVPAEFKRDIIHYGITAEHPAFQRLILLYVLNILWGTHSKEVTCRAPEKLASIVCCFLGWSKGVGGLLRIIKDQSRYMTLRNPDLRRNYVSDKTRRDLSTIMGQYTRLVLSLGKFDILLWAKRIVKEGEYRDDGYHLPTSDKPPDMRLINHLHHAILREVCCDVVGRDRCPPIDDHGRFILDEDFIPFITNVASLVINIARHQPRNNRRALYCNIGRIVVCLQEIIAARSYLSECKQTWTMAANREAVRHHEVLFLFLAFRVILLYILPWDTGRYGVQQVARDLPIYARIQKFNLPLHKLYEALRN